MFNRQLEVVADISGIAKVFLLVLNYYIEFLLEILIGLYTYCILVFSGVELEDVKQL